MEAAIPTVIGPRSLQTDRRRYTGAMLYYRDIVEEIATLRQGKIDAPSAPEIAQVVRIKAGKN
jgi:hypothetical protein